LGSTDGVRKRDYLGLGLRFYNRAGLAGRKLELMAMSSKK
jgi:hypothetical protein